MVPAMVASWELTEQRWETGPDTTLGLAVSSRGPRSMFKSELSCTIGHGLSKESSPNIDGDESLAVPVCMVSKNPRYHSLRNRLGTKLS